jgi:drug/metabolite transporter (DMT)-like permease
MNTYLAIGIVLAALWPVVLNFATGMNIYEFMFLEYLTALPASVLLVLYFKKQKGILEILRNKKMLAIVALISLLNYGFQDFGMLYAEHFITAALASVIFRSYPLLMLLFLPVVTKEKVSKYQLAALGLGFFGICLIFAGGATTGLGSMNVFGVFIVLAVALATAFSLCLTKRYVVDIQSAVFFFNLFSLAMFSIAFFFAGMPMNPLTSAEIFSILYTGVIYSVLFGFLYYRTLNTLKTTMVTNFYFLAPFLTFVFSYFILSEQIPLYYVIAAVLVSAGVLIQKLDKVGGAYLANKERKLNDVFLFDVTGIFAETGEVAISTAIKEGGRVLAMKLDGVHKGVVEEFANNGMHSNVYTDEHDAIPDESRFVRDVMGAGEGEMVVMKAGKEEEGEAFFEGLLEKVGDSQVKQ